MEEKKVIVVSGSYRKIRAKIQKILLARKENEFLTIQTVDKSGMSVSYSGLTDIMNFLHKLETVLIPIEDAENTSQVFQPVKIFRGNRF